MEKKWAACAWGKKLAVRAKREAATDFERFKLMVAKVKRSKAIKRHLAGAPKGKPAAAAAGAKGKK